MKKIFSLFACLMVVALSYAQTTYNPSLHATLNKAVGIAQGAPTDARTMFFDPVNFVYRAFTSTSEVISYLNLPKYRQGGFDIIINTGGSLSNGVITGGVNSVWYFKDGTAPGNLVRKGGDVLSVNGQTGDVVSKNADSLKNIPFDNSVLRNAYVLTYDSVLNKMILAPSVGTVYAAGAGIDITNGIISAQTDNPIWNASKLRGRNISTLPPPLQSILKWNGTEYAPAPDIAGLDTATFDGDTLRLFVSGNEIKIPLHLTGQTDAIVYIGWGLTGLNTDIDRIRLDTSLVATKSDLTRDSIGRIAGRDSIDFYRNGVKIFSIKDSTISPGSGDNWGTQKVEHDLTLKNYGVTGSLLGVDTTQRIATKYDLSVIGNPDGSETIIVDGIGYTVNGVGTPGSPYSFNLTGSPTANPFKALSIETVPGASANVVIPGTGNNVTGTDNTPFLNTLLSTATDGQWVVIPNGNWGFFTPVDTIKTTKRVNILILGNTYHNGSDFLIFASSGGPFRQNNVMHYGLCVGRINMPTHGKTTHDNGTSPVWSSFTGTPFKIYNTFQVHIKFNKIEGFKNGVEIIGNDYDGAGRGSQENTISGRWIFKCANGLVISSPSGVGYCDKNVFTGWDNGLMRVSGGLAIKVDGFSGNAPNGEPFNLAARSNEYHILVESVDSIAECHADMTEPLFDVTVEGGTNTGVFGAVGWRMRSVSPNYVRSPQYVGRGVFSYLWLQNGMGINGEIHVPIWNSSQGRYYGNFATIDDEGNIVFQGSTAIQLWRTQAPANFRYAPFGQAEKDTAITSATYTVASKIRYVDYNNASATLTLPSASTFPQRIITVFNSHATAALSVTGTGLTGASIPAGDVMTYRSNGTNWRGIINAKGTGGGGGPFTADANGYTTSSRLGIQVASRTDVAMALPASTTTLAPLIIPAGAHPTSPADGLEWRVAARRFTAYGSVTYEYTMVPNNGQPLDIIRRNAANTGYEHIQPNYERKLALGADFTFTSTAGETSIFNPPVGNDDREAVPIGSSFRFISRGIITITNDATDPIIRFYVGSVLAVAQIDLPTGMTNKSFEIETVITRRTSDVFWRMKIVVENGAINLLRTYEGTLPGYTTSGTDFDATWQWMASGNSVTFKDAYWEIFRLQ